jgi:hypothetical protein
MKIHGEGQMDRGQADILVGDLAKALGISSLVLDEGGMCILQLEEGQDSVLVSIGHNAGAGSLDLMACLPGVEPSPARVAAALLANFDADGGGATFAAEESTGALVLQRRYFGPDLGDGGLPGAVGAFADEAIAWTKEFLAIEGLSETAGAEERRAGVGIRA